jgi:hypothetical protein
MTTPTDTARAWVEALDDVLRHGTLMLNPLDVAGAVASHLPVLTALRDALPGMVAAAHRTDEAEARECRNRSEWDTRSAEGRAQVDRLVATNSQLRLDNLNLRADRDRLAAQLAEAREALDRNAVLLDNAAALEGDLRDDLAEASNMLSDFVDSSDCMSLTPGRTSCGCLRCQSRRQLTRVVKRLAGSPTPPARDAETPTTETSVNMNQRFTYAELQRLAREVSDALPKGWHVAVAGVMPGATSCDGVILVTDDVKAIVGPLTDALGHAMREPDGNVASPPSSTPTMEAIDE